MALNKLEHQIKEKLNSREIKPTEMAWDRLDAMLSVAEEKKTKRFSFLSFQFIGIAASILVFISLGLFFLNQEKTSISTDDTIVTKEIVKDSVFKKTHPIEEKFNNNNKGTIQEKQQLVQSTSQKHQTEKTNQLIINQKTIVNPIINYEKEIEFQTNEIIAQKDLHYFSTQEKIIISKPIVVNVDDLLSTVESTKKTERKATITVNPNSLLSQVDGELNQTFREKVIKKINKNYREVKVALATRNQE
ncbi:hypothetical protein [Flavobacterium sp.]|uniref:hypothetical protein n=1 Tax=Flavobacterium sp. TaxID=239 RepID=UPI0037534BC1